jgi:hypothetical protein
MKLLVIPDVHGLDAWKDQVKDIMHMPDSHVVFLGDYVDSRGEQLGGYEIMSNLNDIIDFKNRYPEKVTLLLGNHDYAYIFGKTAMSGFNVDMWPVYRSIINDNWKLFDIAWGYTALDGKYTLLTHAGLTNWFYAAVVRAINDPEHVMNKILGEDELWKSLPLHELLNYFKDQCELMWKIGTMRWGSSPSGSILWADKRELMLDPYPKIDQMVGHTPGKYIDIRLTKNGERLYFSDMHNEWEGSHRSMFIELR